MSTGCGMRWGTRRDVYLSRDVEATDKTVISLLHVLKLLCGSEEPAIAWIRHAVRHVLLHFHVRLAG